MAGALARLGVDRALVVSSADGLDEMSTSGADPRRRGQRRRDRALRRSTPEDVGLPRAAPDAVAGGTPAENAATTRAILAGEAGPAPRLALLNAGAAIYAAGRAASTRRGRRAPRAEADRLRRRGRDALSLRPAQRGARERSL